MVGLVGDEEVAGAVHGHTTSVSQAGAGGRAAVAAKGSNPIASHRGDDARDGIHLPDALVALVGDEEVAGAVHGHTTRETHAGAGGRAAVAAKASTAVAGHGGDDAGDGVHLADATVVRVGDEEVT